MTWIIIAWVAGVIPFAAFLGWRDPYEDTSFGAVAMAWLWPFFVIVAVGIFIGQRIAHWRGK